MGLRTTLNLSLFLLVLSGAGSVMAAGQFYCCVDEQGKQVCGDILPHACYGRAYRELGSSGRTMRNVEAPLTAEQRAQRAVEDERRKEQENVLREQKRKDQALLDTYGTEKDLEVLRRRSEQDVNMSIKAAADKIAEAYVQRKKFENEAEFYKKKQMPAAVEKGLRDADAEIEALQSVITSKQKDLELIRLKFDEDQRRFRELVQRRPTLQ
jgi:hypothetical protein